MHVRACVHAWNCVWIGLKHQILCDPALSVQLLLLGLQPFLGCTKLWADVEGTCRHMCLPMSASRCWVLSMAHVHFLCVCAVVRKRAHSEYASCVYVLGACAWRLASSPTFLIPTTFRNRNLLYILCSSMSSMSIHPYMHNGLGPRTTHAGCCGCGGCKLMSLLAFWG